VESNRTNSIFDAKRISQNLDGRQQNTVRNGNLCNLDGGLGRMQGDRSCLSPENLSEFSRDRRIFRSAALMRDSPESAGRPSGFGRGPAA
jgi:hypothetical protein